MNIPPVLRRILDCSKAPIESSAHFIGGIKFDVCGCPIRLGVLGRIEAGALEFLASTLKHAYILKSGNCWQNTVPGSYCRQ